MVNALNIGGTEKILIDTINRMDPERYSISIISLSPYSADKSIFRVCPQLPHVRVFYIPFGFYGNYSLSGYLWLLFRPRRFYTGIEALSAQARSLQPQIIHFHTSPRELLLRKFLGIPARYVFTDHTLRIGGPSPAGLSRTLLSLLFRRFYKGFSVITVSEEIRNSLYRYRIVPPSQNVLVLLNSIDPSHFVPSRHSDTPAGLRAVYVSRIDHNKGHADLLKAWSLLGDIPDKHLFIVGPDALSGQMQALADQLGCRDSVSFTGAVSDPREILEKSNLALFPSYKEGLPLSLLEKMAMCLPVIVSDIPELSAVIRDQENGLVFRTGDAADLAARIRHLYRHPELAAALGRQARQTVETRYNSSEVIRTLDTFYSSVLK
jgi:glycosyltransferase involved in cell wall biosynthesis